MTTPACLDRFHPLVRDWFVGTFDAPTPPQEFGWPAIALGRHALVCAPTGSGKTLAAFLWAIDGLVRSAMGGKLEDRTSVVYVSPLKALSNDIQKNLWEPLRAIRQLAEERGTPLPEIRVAVRTGDTPAKERESMRRRPPHILITTPESLYILLTVESSRRYLASARTVIVDEIHAVAADKRGAHLALSLERLDDLAGAPLQRIGLSATQRPIEEIGRLLVGTRNLTPDGAPDCAIVDVGHGRDLDLRRRGAGPAARGGRQPRHVGRGVRPDCDPRQGSPDDHRLRQHAKARGTGGVSALPAIGKGCGGGPPREPVAGNPPEGGTGAEGGDAQGGRRHGVAGAGDRHRARGPGLPSGRAEVAQRPAPARGPVGSLAGRHASRDSLSGHPGRDDPVRRGHPGGPGR